MARPIDADALIKRFTEIKESGVSLRDAVYLDGVMAVIDTASTLSPWVSVEDDMPPEHKPVLCIASGRPKPNITLEEAYQLGSWNRADGWIIDEYLDWEDADVSWWMPLPEPPGKEG